MRRAHKNDKANIVNILASSFEDNKSVNYIIKQDSKRKVRIKRLMEYAYEMCKMFGDVFITDDKCGCALVVMPDKKRTTLQSVILDIKFAFTAIGILNIKKAMSREAKISSMHPEGPLYYLWFIGVEPGSRQKGIGSRLLTEVMGEAEKNNRTVCLLSLTPSYQKSYTT